MAHGGIALPTDDETPPVRLTRLREKLFVTPARYGTIIVGDIAFILYLITEIIFKGYFIIVLAALLPVSIDLSKSTAAFFVEGSNRADVL